jgi:acetyl esterase/lipase
MSFWLLLRLLLAVLCMALASHLVILFNNQLGWKLTLVAGEYGHRVALFALLLLPVGLFHVGWVARAGTVLLLLSIPILLWPLVQSKRIAKVLPEDLEAAFPLSNDSPKAIPVSYDGLWLGHRQPAHEHETHFYAEAGGVKLKLLFHAAKARTAAPCIVVLHGGGWQNGTPDEFPEWNTWWTSRGYAVAAIQYRLAPQNRWPAQYEDVRLAMQWLKGHAVELGIGQDQFILLGRSAGGQIATACAYGLQDPGILGCVSIYGPADMIFARRFAFEDDVLNSLRLLRNYLGGDPDTSLENYESASSYLIASEKSCPTLLIHGTRDALVWNMQSRRLAEKLRLLKVPHHLLELPWGTHGFDWPFEGPGGQLTRYAVDHFLDSLTRKKGD